MKVKDLIRQLQGLNKPEQVVCYVNEYEGTLDPIDAVAYSEDDNKVIITAEVPDDE